MLNIYLLKVLDYGMFPRKRNTKDQPSLFTTNLLHPSVSSLFFFFRDSKPNQQNLMTDLTKQE